MPFLNILVLSVSVVYSCCCLLAFVSALTLDLY